MRLTRALLLGAILLPGVAAAAGDKQEGRTAEQKANADKTDKAAKKGALKEKKSPAADLKAQQANVKRLRQNARDNRKIGNRAGAWAAEMDAKHAEKLIEKDKKILRAEDESK